MSEYYENLEWKVKELEKENAELKERSVSIIQANSVLDASGADEVGKIKKELEECKVNEKYWKDTAMKYSKYCNDIV
jgi:regulator of replication initiation timing